MSSGCASEGNRDAPPATRKNSMVDSAFQLSETKYSPAEYPNFSWPVNSCSALEASYFEAIGPHISGIDKLPRRFRRGKMRVISTSVVEKHQDLLVGRRMKKKGMRWSKKGANNLLALQSRRFCNRWPTEWGMVPE